MKTALVTGGTRGIGEAIARGLAKKGFSVIITGRDAKRGEAVADAIEGRFVPLDMTKSADIARTSFELDVLVNNAGAAFDGFDAGVARRTLDTNFVGTMLLTDHLVQGGKMRSHARIVMVSSGMGEVDCLSPALQKEVLSPTLDRKGLVAFVDRFVSDVAQNEHAKKGWPPSAYRISKVAMNAYVRILSRELPSDIKVNAACPGWVKTQMGGRSAPRSVEEGADTPLWLAMLGDNGPTGGFYRDRHAVEW